MYPEPDLARWLLRDVELVYLDLLLAGVAGIDRTGATDQITHSG